MNKEEVEKIIKEHLGFQGAMISHSKSGYRKRNPQNIVAFNANVYAYDEETKESKKIWWGDFDLSEKRNTLKNLAAALNCTIILLNEMWGRFEYEENPQLQHYIYRVDSNGKESLSPHYSNVLITEDEILWNVL